MGIWLGIVAWRANSIVPAVLCHAFNNAIGIVIVQSAMNDPQSEQALPPFWVMAIALLVLVVGVIMVIKHGGKRAGESLGTRGVIVR